MSETDEQIRKIEPTQWRVAAVIAAFAAGAFLYKLLMGPVWGGSKSALRSATYPVVHGCGWFRPTRDQL